MTELQFICITSQKNHIGRTNCLEATHVFPPACNTEIKGAFDRVLLKRYSLKCLDFGQIIVSVGGIFHLDPIQETEIYFSRGAEMRPE